jgi:enoyl-CoA hydratase/carnithine racemase
MAVLEWKKDGTVALVSMINGENRVNPVLLNEMLTVMDEIESDESIHAVVITSSDPKNWSQGIDLNWMAGRFAEKDLQSVRNFFYSLNNVVRRFLLYPMPVIAAINGHAAAAGGVLACACDFRFMRADRGFFFLPEIDVDVAVLPGFTALFRKVIAEPKLGEMLYTSKHYVA